MSPGRDPTRRPPLGRHRLSDMVLGIVLNKGRPVERSPATMPEGTESAVPGFAGSPAPGLFRAVATTAWCAETYRPQPIQSQTPFPITRARSSPASQSSSSVNRRTQSDQLQRMRV